jgi:hypothetical protein
VPATRRLGGTAVTFALLLAGLYSGYCGIFHGWASSTGPVSFAGAASRAWHHTWSVRFFGAMCAFFVLAALWAARHHLRRRGRPAG